jgi:hypothetical protein
MSYRAAYFVYDARCGAYKGPFKAAEVAIAVRDCLGGVPGVTETVITKTGPALKSAVELNHEYGTTCETVMYFAKKTPPQDVLNGTIYLTAYKWIDWQPVYHTIADELLRALSGKHYELLEAYLTQFRNLDQPLPALTLVGPRKTWKSKICEILSRYWTTEHGASAGDATKIMVKFNDHLLKNPVIWSDEELAVTSYGKPQPEAYRKSITAKMHHVEPKGMQTVTLISAIRHMIAVNDDSKVFSSEVDADSIYATMERFLLLYTDADQITKFEEKWAGTAEIERLRTGETLLEHVRWIEQNRKYESQGRLFVIPHTEAQTLLRARFADDTLLYIWQLAFDALERETGFSNKGQFDRLPLMCDDKGHFRLSPKRVHEMWGESKITANAGVKKPTTQKIGTILTKAGFKFDRKERASKSKYEAWRVDHNTLKQFIEVSDSVTAEKLAYWAFLIGRVIPEGFQLDETTDA